MRKLATIACAFLVVFAMAFALCGCTVNVTINKGSSSASSSGEVSASSAASSVGGSASGSNDAASSSGSASSASVSASASSDGFSSRAANGGITVTEDGEYSDKDHVALYIHEYGHLPSNYVSKTKARKAGWVSSKGNLQEVLPGKSIGGSVFHNDEGALPDAQGRQWTECDIDYEGGYRNAKRIVFSNDGLIFYTGDHYKTFEQLY